MVIYKTVDARNAKTATIIHSLRFIIGDVKPPTKQIDNARKTNMNEIGLGNPATNKASLLIPISNKVVKDKVMFAAAAFVAGFLNWATFVAHKASLVFYNSSRFFLNLASSIAFS